MLSVEVNKDVYIYWLAYRAVVERTGETRPRSAIGMHPPALHLLTCKQSSYERQFVRNFVQRQFYVAELTRNPINFAFKPKTNHRAKDTKLPTNQLQLLCLLENRSNIACIRT